MDNGGTVPASMENWNMLEALREQRRNKVILIILGVIIVVFVVFFGPQSSGYTTKSDTWAGKAAGQEVTDSVLRATVERWRKRDADRLTNTEFAELRKATLDDIALVLLLAERAEASGLSVSPEAVSCYIVNWHDDYHKGGKPICRDFPPEYKVQFANVDYDYFYSDEEGGFSKEYRDRIAGYFGRSVADYEVFKGRELLALQYLSWLSGTIALPPETVAKAYARRNEKVELEYVSLDPAQVVTADVSDADADVWATANAAKIDAAYNDPAGGFDRPLELKLRRIYIRKPSDGGEAEKAAAKSRYEAALTRAKAEDFETVVRALTELDREKESGGDMGFRSADNVAAEVFDAVKEKKVGDIATVEQDFAWSILKVEEIHPAGKKPLAEVQGEIAKKLLKESRTKTAADSLGKRGKRILELAATSKSLAEAVEAEAKEVGGDTAQVKSGSTGLFAREGVGISYGDFKLPAPPADAVPSIGRSRELMKLAFSLKKEAPLHPTPVLVDGVPFIVRLKDHVAAPSPAVAKDLAGLENELRTQLLETALGEMKQRARLLVHAAAGDPSWSPYMKAILDGAVSGGGYKVNEPLFVVEPEVEVPAVGNGSGG